MAYICSSTKEYQAHLTAKNKINERVGAFKAQIIHDLVFNQEKEITEACEFYGFDDADLGKKFLCLAARNYDKYDEDASDVLGPYLEYRVEQGKID